MNWIKTSERLPEDKIRVLLSIEYVELPVVGFFIKGNQYLDDNWFVDVHECLELDRYADEHVDGLIDKGQYKVTHWMPLPENPEVPVSKEVIKAFIETNREFVFDILRENYCMLCGDYIGESECYCAPQYDI